MVEATARQLGHRLGPWSEAAFLPDAEKAQCGDCGRSVLVTRGRRGVAVFGDAQTAECTGSSEHRREPTLVASSRRWW